ncbi:hypothetical protein [Pedobacter sp. Leaf176]|uniref:DUF6929 family protein n=1 Tax=Pedobacter sp. Leaf176 TaxID=1736286 RepID=UPI0006F420DA|nr:hypothetical protein [Pedobacter sp. Leaf176]KQR69875.1 hypothetical protein ASF92_14335 [Pedobacter sp. Leaf176]
MHSTELEVFAEIHGIGSASGLFLKEKKLYIIGDNSANLNEFDLSNNQLHKINILFKNDLNALDNIAKADKADFEVLCNYRDRLFILGSGSAKNRNVMIDFDLQTKEIIERNLTHVYNKIKNKAKIDDDNFNIEGAIFTGKSWLLFNRGNGKHAKNGIFAINGEDLTKSDNATFLRINLPNVNHVESSFTDAVLYRNEIFFIATAEDTKSTYNDGAILGSFVGSINLQTLELNFATKISDVNKFEGICFFEKSKNKIEFLLCEDRDTEELKSTIYRLTMNFQS